MRYFSFLMVFVLFLGWGLFSCSVDSHSPEQISQPIKLWINSQLGECQLGEKCLLISDAESNPVVWQILPNSIKGFKYQEGYLYQLSVKKTVRFHSEKDQPSLQFELIKILSQETVD